MAPNKGLRGSKDPLVPGPWWGTRALAGPGSGPGGPASSRTSRSAPGCVGGGGQDADHSRQAVQAKEESGSASASGRCLTLGGGGAAGATAPKVCAAAGDRARQGSSKVVQYNRFSQDLSHITAHLVILPCSASNRAQPPSFVGLVLRCVKHARHPQLQQEQGGGTGIHIARGGSTMGRKRTAVSAATVTVASSSKKHRSCTCARHVPPHNAPPHL